jgi:phosphatidylinositol alpha-1,6-mannosyltransferase
MVVPVAHVPRTLVVTNDFPPRVGGVQQYVWNLAANLPPDRVAVFAPTWPGAREHDARQPFAVHRWPSRVLLPTAAARRRAASLVEEHDADVVLFGHGFPLPSMGLRLAERGTPYVVMTHGAEVWQACVPALAGTMRRALVGARAVTAVSRYTGSAIRASLGLPHPIALLAPGVDERRFRPDVDGRAIRERLGMDGRPLLVSISRLVARKGHDVLIAAMPDLTRIVPDAALLIAGDGPHRGALDRLSAGAPPGSVVLAGAVPDHELPAYHAAADVFAMPCRSRLGGLEVEGFGIVYLEAGATARPVIAGRSGGAAEAVVDGVTGLLVEAREPKAVALAIASLLIDPDRAARYGAAARSRIEAGFTWTDRAERLTQILAAAAG